jgi:hypothetical protein
MYYSDADVDEWVKQIKDAEPAYMDRMAENVGLMLLKKRDQYKTFGVYWWAVKKMIQERWKGIRAAWFMGNYSDRWMLSKAWHGSLFKTVVAGAYYHGQQITQTAECWWTDEHGVDHPYTLFDEDAGQ